MTWSIYADPQQRLAMSEEAAAAVDADAAHDKASHSRAFKTMDDSARAEPNDFHVFNDATDGNGHSEKTVDAAQVAEKVGVAQCILLLCWSARVGHAITQGGL